MNNKNLLYVFRFLTYFFMFFYIFKMLEGAIIYLLTIVISKLLNLVFYKNIIIIKNNVIEISPVCTCSLEMALFLAYIFGTPNVPIRYKILYSTFGLIIINITNILRIIFILKNAHLANYTLIHDIISFILFPVALILNLMWVKILLKIGIIKK